MNVFFIDDDAVINRYHEIIFEPIASDLNLSLSFYTKPFEAIELFKETEKFPEIIFLDINMPIMNGWEFLEEYKNNGFPSNVVIIILTTSHNPNYLEKSRQNKLVNELKTKPIGEDDFKKIIEKYHQ